MYDPGSVITDDQLLALFARINAERGRQEWAERYRRAYDRLYDELEGEVASGRPNPPNPEMSLDEPKEAR